MLPEFKEQINAVELQMQARLAEIRKRLHHRGNKGASVEAVVREFLREYLPRRFDVGHGEIVDQQGQRSPQTDVVIVNEDHPGTFTHNEPGLFFIEGVSAVGEVKTVLTSSELERCLEASGRYRRLQRRLPNGTMSSASSAELNRFVDSPAAFVIAFESELSFTAILDRIENFVERSGHPSHATGTVFDAVFILERGWAMNFGDGSGSIKLAEQPPPTVGWRAFKTPSVLFGLLSWLSASTPRWIAFDSILLPYLMRQPNRAGQSDSNVAPLTEER